MTSRAAFRLSWSVWGLCVALIVGTAALVATSWGTHVPGKHAVTDLVVNAVLLVLPTVGALVASRRPANPIGWLLLGAGVVFALSAFASQYAIQALYASPGSLPGGRLAAWFSEWASYPAVLMAGALVLLLCPHGRLISPRWQIVVWAAISSAFLISLGTALAPGYLFEFTSVENPVGIDAASGVIDVLGGIGWVLFVVTIITSAVSVVVRYRRARGEDREQLKWIAGGAAVLGVLWIVALTVPLSQEADDAIFLVGLTVFPLSVGIAILRYRLYEIDRIINRTLVYGAVTALLAGLYFGIVIGLQAAFSGLTRGNDLAIAGSTLAVAALFRPVRSRIQAFVDRRFYRRRYDAEQTLAEFSTRLRDEVNLDELAADLAAVVRETMQPSHVSVWLRDIGTRVGEPKQDSDREPVVKVRTHRA